MIYWVPYLVQQDIALAADAADFNGSVEWVGFEEAQNMPIPVLESVKQEIPEDMDENDPVAVAELDKGNMSICSPE